MKKVAILMGSESDRAVLETSLPYYEFFGIPVEMHVMSAHRTPGKVHDFAGKARENGYGVIVACAGMAAHLPGVVAAYTTLPVIGVPLASGELNGVDSLYSIVQMPAGVPVATMGIGKSGARNAAVLAAEILGLSDEAITQKLNRFKQQECKI
ncbi:MAG: 5-(carboxyamino)imidazole ribonucleotide mutase [Calditrichae bacterium]|nr:5-(carboxyamino)imidazole ribonucleotide mutase [Calditrichota bacterium]MCB0314583.1 5-(carboxyamino)imidazole ribonucleotide mutase [Calditrichota bacterium]MCB9089270.1 5-(carboxyamino)imidazole ribonucleotide mutase [Calditrichia bacterium]